MFFFADKLFIKMLKRRRESVLTFWIGILKSAELLKADVEEKEYSIFKGEGVNKSCRRV